MKKTKLPEQPERMSLTLGENVEPLMSYTKGRKKMKLYFGEMSKRAQTVLMLATYGLHINQINGFYRVTSQEVFENVDDETLDFLMSWGLLEKSGNYVVPTSNGSRFFRESMNYFSDDQKIDFYKQAKAWKLIE